MVLFVGWLGCAPECTPEACAEIGVEVPPADAAPVEAPPPTLPVTPLEQLVVTHVLEQVRQGVRAWPSENAVGVCRGRKECDKYLGLDAGKMTRGSYFIRADLAVPPGPQGTYKVAFSTECVTPAGELRTFEREFEVTNNGDNPFRLQPLRSWSLPNSEGPQTCSWKLVARNPNVGGTEGAPDRVFMGTWVVERR